MGIDVYLVGRSLSCKHQGCPRITITSVFEMVVLATDLLMLRLTTPPSLVSKPVSSKLTELFAAALACSLWYSSVDNTRASVFFLRRSWCRKERCVPVRSRRDIVGQFINQVFIIPGE